MSWPLLSRKLSLDVCSVQLSTNCLVCLLYVSECRIGRGGFKGETFCIDTRSIIFYKIYCVAHLV